MIVRLAGGMCNQMFQAAFGLSESHRRNNEVLRLHPHALGPGSNRAYSLDCFQRKFHLTAKVPATAHTYQEQSFGYDPEIAKQPVETHFIGNFQTEKYFEPALVREAFRFTKPLTEESVSWRYRILMHTSCFIHIRRSDYLNVQHYHGMPTMDYYNQAIKYVKDRTSKVNFFVFSDDHDWCRNTFTDPEFQIVDCNGFGSGDSGPAREHEDLQLMQLCDHAIMANSSFSWWGAWLGEEIHPKRMVIAPKQWFNPTGPAAKFDVGDLIPERWVRL